MSVRWRLTLYFALMLCVILIISGVLLNFILQRNLISAVDDNLRIYAAEVHGTLHSDNVSGPPDYSVIHSELPLINEFSSPTTYIQIIDRNGKVLVKSDSLSGQELPVNPALIEKGFSGIVTIQTVSAGGDARVRILVSPLYLKDQTLLLEVADSLKPVDIAMNQVRMAIAGSVFLALLLAGISGGFIVRRALKPVKKITQLAMGIETCSDLSRRVGYEGPQDEIGQLASTFDRMIGRLHQAFLSHQSFIADASHELRSPLTVIGGNVNLLKRNLNEEDRKESLRAIEAESRRMSKIVSDLLFLAEIEGGQINKHEEVSLREIVLEEQKRAQQLAGTRKVVIGRQEDLKIKGDPYRLRQLLANLADNAIKYTPEDGTITLSVYGDGEWAWIEVMDNGVGIAPEDQARIFDRFYRADKSRSRASGGSGLGLAIVKGIAEQHGGKVTVESEPGKGSVFTAWFKI